MCRLDLASSESAGDAKSLLQCTRIAQAKLELAQLYTRLHRSCAEPAGAETKARSASSCYTSLTTDYSMMAALYYTVRYALFE
jgi:hypothetical protein